MKPTFKGKLNLKDTGAQNTDQGIAANTSYTFNVTYKSERKEGEQKEGE